MDMEYINVTFGLSRNPRDNPHQIAARVRSFHDNASVKRCQNLTKWRSVHGPKRL